VKQALELSLDTMFLLQGTLLSVFHAKSIYNPKLYILEFYYITPNLGVFLHFLRKIFKSIKKLSMFSIKKFVKFV